MMGVFLLALLGLSKIAFAAQQGAADETLVSLGGKIALINHSSSCAAWQNPQERCTCCIVKQVGAGNQKKRKAQTIADECINEGSCKADTVAQLIGTDPAQQSQKINRLYWQTSVVKPIDVTGAQLDERGRLEARGLATLLERAYQEGKITNPDFAKIECLDIRNIKKEVRTGLATQIILVNSLCNPGRNYIVKGLRVPANKSGGPVHVLEEAVDLAKGAAIKDFKDFTFPTNKPGYPIIVFPTDYFSYTHNGATHVLAIMPKAEGVSVGQVMEDYSKNPSPENMERAKYLYAVIGEATALFHKRFMTPDFKGIRHLDFHNWNIIVDEKKDPATVYFIDTEGIGKSFEQQDNVFQDIGHLFYNSPLRATFRSLQAKKDWSRLSFEIFIRAYLQVFNGPEREKVLQELKNLFQIPPAHPPYREISDVFSPILEGIQRTLYEKHKKPVKPKFETSVDMSSDLLQLANTLFALDSLH